MRLKQPADAAGHDAALHWRDWAVSARNVSFLIGVPLMMAVIRAWNPGGDARASYWSAVLYWFTLLMPLWVLMDLCTRALLPLQARLGLRLPLWLLLIAGGMIAIVPMRVYLIVLFALREVLLDPDAARALTDWPGFWPNWSEFVGSIEQGAALLTLWLAINLVHVRVLKLPRLGYGPAIPGVPAAGVADDHLGSPDIAPGRDVGGASPPAFLTRLSRNLGSGIQMLQAQDHYIRVVTDTGSELLLYRFSEAIDELRGRTTGARVHRSFWVAKSAVVELIRRDGRHFCLLRNGDRVPVSRTYLAAARRLLL